MSELNHPTTSGRFSGMATLPAVLLAMLPRVACPCQLPAWAGVGASLGCTFLAEPRTQFSLTAAALTLALGGLAVGMKRRRRVVPFVLGCIAAALILAGQVVPMPQAAAYGGALLLLVAAVWNSWPAKQVKFSFDAEGNVALRHTRS